MASEIARGILRNQSHVSTLDKLENVLQILTVLIKEGMQQPIGYPGVQSQRRGGETDETIEEQGWLARIVHLIQSSDNDTQLKVSVCTLCWISGTAWTDESIATASNAEGLSRG